MSIWTKKGKSEKTETKKCKWTIDGKPMKTTDPMTLAGRYVHWAWSNTSHASRIMAEVPDALQTAEWHALSAGLEGTEMMEELRELQELTAKTREMLRQLKRSADKLAEEIIAKNAENDA